MTTPRLLPRPRARLWRLALVAAAGWAVPAGAPAQPAAPPAIEDTVRLTPPGLAGTLLVPAAAGGSGGPVPLVVMIAGSGPTDRDGNSVLLPGANNSFRMLAQALAARGIASVRYDKRGVAASRAALAREQDAVIDSLVADATAWVRRFRRDPRFGPIVVLGHSEGSLIGMLAARRAGADAFVSVAGAGRPAQRVIHDQLARQLPAPLLAQADRALDTLAAGRPATDAPPALAMLFRPSVQPYLISWFRYDPAAELARLAVPVLVAQGTADLQVDTAEARRLVAARPGARLLVVPGMNHVLKLVPDDPAANRRAYSDPALPVAPALADGVVAFVRAVWPVAAPPPGHR